MILLFGGTTEGRAAARVLDEAGSPFFYSTKGNLQEIRCSHGHRLTGAMTVADMVSFCRKEEIRLIVDAAHPFAEELHASVAEATEQTGIPVVRYERQYPPREEGIVWCANYDTAAERMLGCHYHKRKRRERLLPRKDRSCPTDGHPYICRRPSLFASFIHSRRRACRFETGGRTPRAGILFTPKRIHYRHHSYRCSSSSHASTDGTWLSCRSSRRIAFGRNSQPAHSGNSRGRRCCRIRSPERCR